MIIVTVCVSVCVCVNRREREREKLLFRHFMYNVRNVVIIE